MVQAMIVFILDRLCVSTLDSLNETNVVGHGIKSVVNLAPEMWTGVGGAVCLHKPLRVESLTRQEVIEIVGQIFNRVHNGLRTAIAERDRLVWSPLFACCYLHAIGHSWDDAWDGVQRHCGGNGAHPPNEMVHKVRLWARECWAALK